MLHSPSILVCHVDLLVTRKPCCLLPNQKSFKVFVTKFIWNGNCDLFIFTKAPADTFQREIHSVEGLSFAPATLFASENSLFMVNFQFLGHFDQSNNEITLHAPPT